MIDWVLPLLLMLYTVSFPLSSDEANRLSSALLSLCSVAVQNELALAQGRFHSRPPLTERCGAVSTVSWHTALFIHPARSAVGPQPDLWIEYWPKVICSAQNATPPPPPPLPSASTRAGRPLEATGRPLPPSWNTSAPVPLRWRGGGSSQIEIKARIQSIECPDLSQPSPVTATRLSALCRLSFRPSCGGALWGQTHGK